MLSGITFGQYFPEKSVVHRADPRLKLVVTLLYIVLLFVANNFLALAAVVAFVFLMMVMSKVPIKLYFRSIKAVIFIVIFTSVLNLFYVSGDPLVKIGFITITLNGIFNAIFMSTRIICLILTSSVLTFTTSPTQLTDAIERLLRPLSYIKVPVHEFAMMMTIALRFVPTLLEETDKIMSAQKARGADMESGGIIQRVKALIPVLIPLFVSAFRRAYELATAMESRCYHGGKGRTKMKRLHFGKIDVIVVGAVLINVAVFVVLNIVFPPAIVF